MAPRVFIVAQTNGTEITDLLVPFAILSAAGIQTEIVATDPGPVNLMSGLELLNLRTIDGIDPNGADLVVVPAVHDPTQEPLLEWLQTAHQMGAMLASICDGVEVLAATGLLEGRRATGHFYSAKRRQRNFPGVNWVQNTRYILDARIFSTAGVSASAPASVRLVEHLVGPVTAAQVAESYGIHHSTDSNHDSAAFSVGLTEVFTATRNWLLGIRKRRYNLQTKTPVDEYMLSLSVDSITRTFRAAVAINSPSNSFLTKNGLTIRSGRAFPSPHWEIHYGAGRLKQTIDTPALEIDTGESTLPIIFQHIAREYGASTANLVGLQLELPNRGASLR